VIPMKHPSISILTLAAVKLVLIASASPHVTINADSQTVRLDRISYHRCEVPTVQPSPFIQPERAVGRSYGPIDVHGISYPSAASDALSEAETLRGGYFDLWNLFPAKPTDAKFAVLLEFEIRSNALKDCYLSIGFNDNCVVFVDRQPVWGLGGGREHALSQNIVSVPLTSGRAQVSLLLWKAGPWTETPESHFTQEWSANVSVCATEGTAWTDYAANNHHVLDTPIVRSLSDLQFNISLPGHREVVIRDLKGNELLKGKVAENGTFVQADEHRQISTPFVGTITLANELAEALVIEGNSTIEEIMRATASAGKRNVPDWEAWFFRCEHLLKPEFLKDRDQWWARKMAHSLAMAGLQVKFDPNADWVRPWKLAKIEFDSYRSAIDGTTQHYRSMVGPLKKGRSRPLAIFLPGAPMPVRPGLESYPVADLKDTTEMLGRIADQYGVDLLWPGNVDIDYGGNYTRRWLDEVLQAFQADHPAVGYRPVYLVGTCAAGVAALGYAETYGGVDGIVCWSPVISRNAYRWPIRDKDWMPMLPAETLAAEATGVDLTKLKPISVYCLFDHNVAGHGDRPGTKRLCDALARSGGTVTQHWIPYPDPVLEWGVRALDSEIEWLNWISWDAPTSGPRSPRKTLPPAQTIKDALISGCIIDPATSLAGQAWLTRWMTSISQYRGAAVASGRTHAPCHVQETTVTRDTLISCLAAERVGARPLEDGQNWAERLKDYSDLWIVELESAPQLTVSVKHCSDLASPAIPAFDLFREGGCRAVAWGLRDGTWELIQVWL